MRSELVRLWSEHNTAAGNTTLVAAEYLEVVATRNGVQDAPARICSRKRLQQAAARRCWLTALSKALQAWPRLLKASLKLSGIYRSPARADHSVGVIVHHVASMYPIEIDVARAVTAGNAVTDVSWDAVAQINAKHAQGQASATKAATLELLRKNSHEAAAAVGAATDAELDQAAPFSLSFGAPMTAQFVIEHALRHSWHHLAKIRAALKR